MPLIFSYGTLQQEDVQLATYGRTLKGGLDELPGYESSRVPIGDPELAGRLGRTHHANATRTGDPRNHVSGMVFEITEDELARTDAYESPFFYFRVKAALASGREAWVYLHRPA